MDAIASWLSCCPTLNLGRRKSEDFVPLKADGKAGDAGPLASDENGRVAAAGRAASHYGATGPADNKAATTAEPEAALSRTPTIKAVPARLVPAQVAPPEPQAMAAASGGGPESPSASSSPSASVSAKFTDRSLGQLHFVLQYIQGKATLYIRIIKGESLAAQDSNGLSDPYVKVHLLPDTGKRTKLRTRTCQRTLNPIWDEEFCYSGVSRGDMETKMLRLSVLDEDTIGFDWMGEILLPLKHLLHGKKEYYEIPLQPKNFELDRTLKSEQEDRGKIMVGLCYAPAKSELTVRIIQCVNLIAMDPNGYSDPFVKLNLKPDQDKSKKYKTEVKKRTLNPEFNEEFSYTLTLQELSEKTLEITVWDKDFGTKNDFMGALVIGHLCSGERWNHWEAAMKQPYQRHDRWHALSPELVPD